MLLELLLYSSMACADADALIGRIKLNRSELPELIVVELVDTVQESAPDCNWDAND